jgi:hypothetical protein
LEEEKVTLDGMVESHDELLMEISREAGLDRIGQDEEDEKEEEDAGNGRDTATPPTAAPPPPVPPVAVPEEINKEGPVEAIPKQEASMLHEVIPANAEPVMPQLRLYHTLMRDYEENPLRLEDDFDYLVDDPSEDHSDMDE